jgi:hypothetical protein
MALSTVSSTRTRTEAKVLTDATLGGVEAAYNAYEVAQAADTTKTWTVRIISAYHDGTNYVIVAEGAYPERNTDPTGQVPELP